MVIPTHSDNTLCLWGFQAHSQLRVGFLRRPLTTSIAHKNGITSITKRCDVRAQLSALNPVADKHDLRTQSENFNDISVLQDRRPVTTTPSGLCRECGELGRECQQRQRRLTNS